MAPALERRVADLCAIVHDMTGQLKHAKTADHFQPFSHDSFMQLLPFFSLSFLHPGSLSLTDVTE